MSNPGGDAKINVELTSNPGGDAKINFELTSNPGGDAKINVELTANLGGIKGYTHRVPHQNFQKMSNILS